jgi:NAD(P)-dependent dehydrogenase (short-subunit alcohol dehydrogenase family)
MTNIADDWFGLTGRVALVTGASSGLGRHFARTLAAAGCTVGLAARREGYLTDLSREIGDAGGRALPLRCDVTDRASVEEMVATLVREAGAPSILVNNAGMAQGSAFLDADDDSMRSVFELNQIAAWTVAQVTCRAMIAAGQGGSVVNIASITGERPIGGAAAYAVSKAAVIHMTKIMALEMARHGIRANALAPGYFATDMNREFLDSDAGQKLLKRSPMRRAGQVEELDGALLLLASDRGAFMTGATIPVDGGHLVSTL